MLTALDLLEKQVNENGPMSLFVSDVRRITKTFKERPKNLATYQSYKNQYTTLLNASAYKNAIHAERHNTHNLWNAIHETFRSLFNLLDLFVTSLVGVRPMAETATPGAQWFFGRDHFLCPSKPSTLGLKLIDFESKLDTLRNHVQPGPQI